MTYLWSPNAAYAQSLWRPCSPADGYPEADLNAAEERIGVAFPVILRDFYLSWGRRTEFMETVNHLLSPPLVSSQAGRLLFMRENQLVGIWGIRLESLAEVDPLVEFGYRFDLADDRYTLDPWVKVAPLSAWLDVWTIYEWESAHGGVSAQRLTDEQQLLVKRHWPTITLNSPPPYLRPGYANSWTFYGKPGLQFQVHSVLWAKAGQPEALDELQQVLGLTWKKRW